jgi:hypothetical protein
MNTDIDKLAKKVDLVNLEAYLQNITYAKLDREEFNNMSDMHFIKLFRLSQFSIEYLIYTQNYLETLTQSLDLQYKKCYDEAMDYKKALKKKESQIK